MFCNGKCEDGDKICGLLWSVTIEDEKGKERVEKSCAFLAMQGELMAMNGKLLAVQQATEGNRNVGEQVGVALTGVFQKGFKKMAKAQLIRDNPALAILDD